MQFLAHRGGPRGPKAPGDGAFGAARAGGRALRARGAQGALRAPWEGGAFGALGAHGGRWDDFEVIPNGMFFRWRFAPSHPCIAEVGQPLKPLKKDLGQVKAQPAATRIPEAEDHLENAVFVPKRFRLRHVLII